jgi:hypothetical protein
MHDGGKCGTATYFASSCGDMRRMAAYDEVGQREKVHMSRTSTALADREYFGYEEAAAYLRSKGIDHATRHTIDTLCRRSKKLGRPERFGRRVYWHRSQLDALIEAL